MQNLLKEVEREEVIDYCFKRYGVDPKAWTKYDLLKRSEGLWLTTSQSQSCENIAKLSSFLLEDSETLGLRILSGRKFPYKITPGFYQVFFKEISKGKISLSEEQALQILKRKTVTDNKILKFEKGYYFCLFQNRLIGVSLKSEEGLVSQVPKSLINQLAKELKLSNE